MALSLWAAWIQPSRRAWQSMRWRAIRSKTRSGAPPAKATRRAPRSGPKRASIRSGSHFSPAITWPPLRPEAPQPGSSASSSATRAPASARCRAADRPVKPPPTTQTSARVSPCSGGVSGALAAVAAQSEAGGAEAVIGDARKVALDGVRQAPWSAGQGGSSRCPAPG